MYTAEFIILANQQLKLLKMCVKKLATFVNAGNAREIIFTRGATEAINLVACSFTETFLKAGDEIIISELDHHSNIVPWQMACERKGSTSQSNSCNTRR